MDNNLRPTRRPEVPSRTNYRGNNLRNRMHGAGSSAERQTEKQIQNSDINHPSEPKTTTDDSPGKQKKQITLSVPSLPRIKFKKIVITTATILLGLLILGGIAFVITKLTNNKQPFPDSIKKQVSFVVFYPDDKQVTEVDKETIKYDTSSNLLIFVGTMSNGTKLTFSQQATPDTLKDIQPVYEALLKRLGEYSSVDTINGKVRLIKPEKLKGGRSAIANWKGTTINVRPSKNIPDDEWKKIFNNLIIVK